MFCTADPPVAISGNVVHERCLVAMTLNPVVDFTRSTHPPRPVHLPQEVRVHPQVAIDYTCGPKRSLGTCWSTNFRVILDFTELSDCLNFEDFFTSFTQAVADDPLKNGIFVKMESSISVPSSRTPLPTDCNSTLRITANLTLKI